MPQSLFQSYMHIIFSTKNRQIWLQDPGLRTELCAYLAGGCKNLKCPAVIVNGYVDHVHLLVRMGKSISAPTLVGKIKQSSSKWIKTLAGSVSGFYWQAGYGCFGICASHIEATRQ